MRAILWVSIFLVNLLKPVELREAKLSEVRKLNASQINGREIPRYIHRLYVKQASDRLNYWKVYANKLIEMFDKNKFVATVCNIEMNYSTYIQHLNLQRRKIRYVKRKNKDYINAPMETWISFEFEIEIINILEVRMIEETFIYGVKTEDSYRIQKIISDGACGDPTKTYNKSEIVNKMIELIPERLIDLLDENKFEAIIDTDHNFDRKYDIGMFIRYMKRFNEKYTKTDGYEESLILHENKNMISFRKNFMVSWNQDLESNQTMFWSFSFAVNKENQRIQKVIVTPLNYPGIPNAGQKHSALELINKTLTKIGAHLQLKNRNIFELRDTNRLYNSEYCLKIGMRNNNYTEFLIIFQIYGNFVQVYGNIVDNPSFDGFMRNSTISIQNLGDQLIFQVRFYYYKENIGYELDFIVKSYYIAEIDTYEIHEFMISCFEEMTDKEREDQNSGLKIEGFNK